MFKENRLVFMAQSCSWQNVNGRQLWICTTVPDPKPTPTSTPTPTTTPTTTPTPTPTPTPVGVGNIVNQVAENISQSATPTPTPIPTNTNTSTPTGSDGTPTEGISKTINGVKYVYKNGQWVQDTSSGSGNTQIDVPIMGSGPVNVNGKTTTGTDAKPIIDTYEATQKANKIIDDALKAGQIDAKTAEIFKAAVSVWEPDKLVNIENVMANFQKIKENTIDPYWREQTSVFQKDLQNQLDQMRTARETQMREESADLEASGMTFTGKDIETLGDKASYSQNPDTLSYNSDFATQGRPLTEQEWSARYPQATIPYSEYVARWNENEANSIQNNITQGNITRVPFGGNVPFQGTAAQQKKLMSSSTSQQYANSLQSLGRKAEDVLGTGANSYDYGGYFNPSGVTVGSYESGKNKAYASAWDSLANGQSSNLTSWGQPVSIYNN